MAAITFAAGNANAQNCPEKNLNYWQAFPAGGESDLSGRHQQVVLKKRCPSIETIIQYKPGARALAVGTPKRSPSLPEIPTVAESGYPGFDASLWLAIMAPADKLAEVLY